MKKHISAIIVIILLLVNAIVLFNPKVVNISKDINNLEIYTNTNIYYPDFTALEIANENNDIVVTFGSIAEMIEYISDITAEESNGVKVDVPEEYELITLETPVKGRWDEAKRTLFIEFDN